MTEKTIAERANEVLEAGIIHNPQGSFKPAETVMQLIRDMQAEIKRLEEYEWMYKDLCK